jgi:serine/threonine-protein kinase
LRAAGDRVIRWLRTKLGRRAPDDEADEADVAPTAPTRREPTALDVLRSLAKGQATSPRAVTEALAELAGGPHERPAIEALLAAGRRDDADPALLVAAGELLLRRGAAKEVAALLEGATTVSGLALRAEAQVLLDDRAGACATLDRALARDVTAPGLLERRARLRASLGLAPPEPPPAPTQATLVTAAGPRLVYRIVAEAGRGGSASVYRAEDDELGRTLALKLYHRPREQKEQVAREARVAVAVAGPGVVRVLDASFDDGWIALGWADGGSLREAIERGDERRRDPAEWLGGVVSALARVHALGFVHGDVKPGNVLLRAARSPLLTDFGLARRPGEPWTGGTPGYLSPERLGGREASTDDDVYALGRTLEDAAPGHPLARALLSPSRPADATKIVLG